MTTFKTDADIGGLHDTVLI